MNITKIMSAKIVTVEMDDTLHVVKEIFDHSHFHHLLVVENYKLAGVISDRDLFRSISPYVETVAETARDAATLKKRVHQIMTRKAITLTPDATVADAIHTFNSNNISCIPIVDENNKPVGIVSWRDILKHL